MINYQVSKREAVSQRVLKVSCTQTDRQRRQPPPSHWLSLPLSQLFHVRSRKTKDPSAHSEENLCLHNLILTLDNLRAAAGWNDYEQNFIFTSPVPSFPVMVIV